MSPLSRYTKQLLQKLLILTIGIFFLAPQIAHAQSDFFDIDVCSLIACDANGVPIINNSNNSSSGDGAADPAPFTGTPSTLGQLQNLLTEQEYLALVTSVGSGRIQEIFNNGGSAANLATLVRNHGVGAVTGLLLNGDPRDIGNVLRTDVNINLNKLGDLLDEVGGARVGELLGLDNFGVLDLDNILDLNINIKDFGDILGANLEDFGNFFDNLDSLSDFQNLLSLDVDFGNFSNLLGGLGDQIPDFAKWLGDLSDFGDIGTLLDLNIDFGNLGSALGDFGDFGEFGDFLSGLGDGGAIGDFFSGLGDFTNFGNWLGDTGVTNALNDVFNGIAGNALGSVFGDILGGAFGSIFGGDGESAFCPVGGGALAKLISAATSLISGAVSGAAAAAGAVLSVPVNDAVAITLLGRLSGQLSGIASSNDFIANETQISRRCLELLVQKEYELDTAAQHAWATLIGQFVAETENFIQEGYNGNPAFLTNQYIYYQLVALSAGRTFAEDVSNSHIKHDTKKTIIRSILDGLFDSNFPYRSLDGSLWADDSVADDLTNSFYGDGGGWAGFNQFFLSPQDNDGGVVALALQDLDRRIQTQLEYEKQKLDWGRGFFSFEICDLAVFKNTDLDRRNCRIATPGALIQDQTSFVFGSALRQMEINDEYEEWIAPNTLAVLSDVLSYRTITSEGFTRVPGEGVTTTAASFADVANVDISSVTNLDFNTLPADDPLLNRLLPYEFDFRHIEDLQRTDEDGNYILDLCDGTNELDPTCVYYGLAEQQLEGFLLKDNFFPFIE